MSHARFLGLMLALAAGAAGCTGEGNAPAAASAPAPVSSGNFAVETIGGEVIVPPGSTQAAQLKIEPVSMRDLAVDEVTAPGRIGIDPNRSSRLLLPVAGRVVAVLAKVGDSVEEGQPVLSVDSPDADADRRGAPGRGRRAAGAGGARQIR